MNKLSNVIVTQQALFDELFTFKSKSSTEEETGQWLLEQMLAITKNILDYGLIDWYEPKLKYSVVKYWIKAQSVVPDLYGELGEAALIFVRKNFHEALLVSVAMSRADYG
ncbi:hypothetical protein [Arsenophonus apicola]|uniref:Uncharacterized protein n=1 Tax=Arsenophonus apicola TaxID=2879119 RepID=A0ABY8P0B7_9GAMM|nr:hypothetical protein [Arsenophonus apicola]WGO82265.1 hypothetical protein QG404_00460 [Arsenophonus apicola]